MFNTLLHCGRVGRDSATAVAFPIAYQTARSRSRGSNARYILLRFRLYSALNASNGWILFYAEARAFSAAFFRLTPACGRRGSSRLGACEVMSLQVSRFHATNTQNAMLTSAREWRKPPLYSAAAFSYRLRASRCAAVRKSRSPPARFVRPLSDMAPPRRPRPEDRLYGVRDRIHRSATVSLR